MSKPLTQLLKKGAFVWSPDAQATFETLKQAMISAPVLRLSDLTKNSLLKLMHLVWELEQSYCKKVTQ